MDKDDIVRNRPAEEGRNNDTNLRDDSGLQPGIGTVTTSNTDDENEHLTRTAGDSFREDREGDDKADATFDAPGPADDY